MCFVFTAALMHVDGPLLASQSQSKEKASPLGKLSKSSRLHSPLKGWRGLPSHPPTHLPWHLAQRVIH